MSRETWLRALGVCAFAVTFPFAALAVEDVPEPSSGWTFDGGLYGWALWLQGDATARDETFNIYADPVDIIKALDGPIIMANFEASRGRFSFYADVVYTELALGSDFATEANPIPQLQFKGDGRIGTELNFGIYQADAFYEVANFAGSNGGKTSFELGAGARYVQLDMTVKAKINANVRVRLGKFLGRIEQGIRRIANRELRLETLARFNDVRSKILEERIIRAGDKGRERAVARLERQLKRVDRRGTAIAALEALERLELELLQVALNLNGQDVSGEFATVSTDKLDWTDPVIAMRMTHAFSNGQSVTAMGDFGGINVEDGLSWQAVLTYNREGTLFGFDTTTSIGYKALWLKYEEDTSKGRRGIDIVLHGPIAELAFRW